MIHCAVRWKSDSFATRPTSADTICTAVEPVPMMPTRAPSIDTPWSQRELWNIGAREGVETVDVGVARVVQHAGGRDHDVDLVAVAARGLELPAAVRRTCSS